MGFLTLRPESWVRVTVPELKRAWRLQFTEGNKPLKRGKKNTRSKHWRYHQLVHLWVSGYQIIMMTVIIVCQRLCMAALNCDENLLRSESCVPILQVRRLRPTGAQLHMVSKWWT